MDQDAHGHILIQKHSEVHDNNRDDLLAPPREEDQSGETKIDNHQDPKDQAGQHPEEQKANFAQPAEAA